MRLSNRPLLLAAGLIFSAGPLVHAERPANGDLLPLLEAQAKTRVLGRVLNGPSVPDGAQIGRVQIKILQVAEATMARDRTAWAPAPEYKVWPVRVHVVVSYTASGKKNASADDAICYAYRGSEGQWLVTVNEPEIRKPFWDRVWNSFTGNGRPS